MRLKTFLSVIFGNDSAEVFHRKYTSRTSCGGIPPERWQTFNKAQLHLEWFKAVATETPSDFPSCPSALSRFVRPSSGRVGVWALTGWALIGTLFPHPAPSTFALTRQKVIFACWLSPHCLSWFYVKLPDLVKMLTYSRCWNPTDGACIRGDFVSLRYRELSVSTATLNLAVLRHQQSGWAFCLCLSRHLCRHKM